MKWQVFLQHQYPGNLWDEWDTLNNIWHNKNPMLSSSFIRLISSYLNPLLYVALGTDSDNSKTMLLLERKKPGIWQVFKPSQATLACIVSTPNSDFSWSELFRSIPTLCYRIDFISLDPNECKDIIDSQTSSELITKAINMQINLESDFDQYWEARPKKLKSNIKRYQSRIEEEQGQVRFEHLMSVPDIKAGTDRYGLLESKGWKGKLKTALHPGNFQGQFYRQFLSAQAEQQAALIIEMYVGNRMIASRLCCFQNGLLIALKTTFDETYKRYAVGRLLLKELIRWGFSRHDIKLIDFYTNASSEQLEWATTRRNMFDASLYSLSLPGKMLSTLSNVKKRLKGSEDLLSSD
ncbi:GNAT family N-acetyltransferase [Arsukibacterium sp.]|uniref:GNAT family N-acetyltransferase n=1 Tax=Arsukibacterium sp. TaxID=1977258 RepID=UPI001BD4B586|nr:GNAT family N-acetyltransferase [Arsukibacterium sp.]